MFKFYTKCCNIIKISLRKKTNIITKIMKVEIMNESYPNDFRDKTMDDN